MRETTPACQANFPLSPGWEGCNPNPTLPSQLQKEGKCRNERGQQQLSISEDGPLNGNCRNRSTYKLCSPPSVIGDPSFKSEVFLNFPALSLRRLEFHVTVALQKASGGEEEYLELGDTYSPRESMLQHADLRH